MASTLNLQAGTYPLLIDPLMATAYPQGKVKPFVNITGGSRLLDINAEPRGEMLGYTVGLAALTSPREDGLYVVL